jgi:hypothetical protein
MNYWEAVGIKTILLEKLNDGMFVPEEWKTAIEDIHKAGFEAMACALQRRYDHYIREWLHPIDIQSPVTAERSE